MSTISRLREINTQAADVIHRMRIAPDWERMLPDLTRLAEAKVQAQGRFHTDVRQVHASEVSRGRGRVLTHGPVIERKRSKSNPRDAMDELRALLKSSSPAA